MSYYIFPQVFRVPETATVLMSGGIAFGELNQDQVIDFQVRVCLWDVPYLSIIVPPQSNKREKPSFTCGG